MRKLLSRLISYIPLTLVLLLIYLVSSAIPQEKAQELIATAGPFGIILFILISFVTYVIAPLSGTPVVFAGYYAFGPNVVFYVTLASYLSFFVNFFIARKFGRPFVERLVGKEGIQRIDGFVKNYGLTTLFFLRMFQGSFHDFISYAAGLTQMKFRDYIIVSTLAIIPGTLVWYYLSLQVSTPSQFVIMSLIVGLGFSALLILGNILVKKIRRRVE